MLKEYKVIDENGIIIMTDVLNDEIDEIPENYILGWGSEKSFFDPVYDFAAKEWVEQKPATEIEETIKQAEEFNSKPPLDLVAEIENLKNENAALKIENTAVKEQAASTSADLQGFMDFYFEMEGL